MKGKKCPFSYAVLLSLIGISLLLGSPLLAVAQQQAAPVLSNDDCIKCHSGPPADISEAGGDHKSEVACQDCHADHKPMSEANIPLCDECHDGEPHYALEGCLGCHQNPHKPLEILIGDKVTDPCLSCHDEQIAQLKEHTSQHTELFCSGCHDVHRKIPDCVDCHDPHSETMVQADCKKCHKAHMPMVLAYDSAVPNQDCGSCHKTALKKLADSSAKHNKVTCVKCHKDTHGNVPGCQECHPEPHPSGIFVKFPNCGDCHYVAHDLNNWPENTAK